MQEKMFRTLNVSGWWSDEGFAVIEWWHREGDNIIKITREQIPFREYMDLPYLYQEVKLKDVQTFN